jgi:hypothetical protein
MTQAILAIPDSDMAPVTQHAVIELSDSRKGDLAEALFIAGCLRRGHQVFKAFGNDHASDYVIICANAPVMTQVKTATIDERGDYTISAKRGRGPTTRPYGRGDFDVLVAYLPDRDALVFWTFDEICGRQNVRYNPARHRQPSNWETLNQVAESLAAHQKSFTPKTAVV